MALNKPSQRENGSVGVSRPLGDCVFSKKYPAILSFISEENWADGTSRVTGTITIFAEGGMAKANINCRDQVRSCFVSGRSITALLDAMEKGLTTDELDWRAKKEDHGKRR